MLPPYELKPTPKAGRNLPAAIGVGVALFGLVAVGLLWVPWLFIAIAAFALCMGVVEVGGALRLKGLKPEVVPVAIGTVLSVLLGYAASVWPMRFSPEGIVVIVLGATMLAVLTTRVFRGQEGFIADLAASALLIAYLPLLGGFISLTMAATDGALRMWLILICSIASDVGAYTVGVLIGKHKMAPSISPGKTWEGFAGGLIFAVGFGILGSIYLLGAPWWVGIPLGLLVSLASVVGDLVESLIKRDAGLKDMSNLLPGHGGWMDRLDALILAVPTGWLVLFLTIGA
ncbi:phosphatidate cytidylyltransferase [Tessaracoccus caeni]|uniref:phosphatidate cytidylyltransferase n=1 Tax=Tessaracoccus caeni TaxID=3031239 RepID=UPI0023DBE8E3|nr:phosphatidate cytidylyltransferase [Tessaracoccus caeni]MDF1486773.1 phosphatidate cytidylyltransferase [Tessaracoccus caeni]